MVYEANTPDFGSGVLGSSPSVAVGHCNYGDIVLNVRAVGAEAWAISKERGWGRGWSGGGCYLHLESSEFIEALRGKGNPVEEAGDVFFVFLSMMIDAGIDPNDALVACLDKIEKIKRGEAGRPAGT